VVRFPAKLLSSPNAAASSFKVSRVFGAESTRLFMAFVTSCVVAKPVRDTGVNVNTPVVSS
jgi:hypothetical protein